MIQVENLSKSYDEVEALSGVSFSVRAGEVIGLLGPNGAGKTTLMKILAGYLHQDAGSAKVDGLEVLDQPEAVQARIGYLPENAPLYPELTVQSSLRMMADLRGILKPEQKARISEAVHAVGLADRLTRPIATLSKGFRQRVGLAQAILHRPSLLILDEPTNGLDPTQIVEVRHLIKKLARQSTVLLSTHILPEVEATCDRAIIIMQGQVRADARLSELAATADALVTISNASTEAALAGLAALPGARHAELLEEAEGRGRYRVHGDTDLDLCPAIFQLASQSGWVLHELRREVRTLEAVFNALAQGQGGVQ
ncbi:MAG: ABC transporter ATP-binding protein [Thermodesulfobacteriota bacterium]